MEKNIIAQNIARETISELHDFVEVGMSELDIENKALELMIKKGSQSFWYHGVGAFVLLGKRSIESISGRDYCASEENRVSENDIVTIDLSPTVDGFWGDYARTIFIEKGIVAKEDNPTTRLFCEGLEAELYLHNKLMEIANPDMTYEEIFVKINPEITKLGFENLDKRGNLGHSVEKDVDERVYIELGSKLTLKEVGKPFTFEPHIRNNGGSFGFKRENIFYFDESGILRLL
ncbi:MAG: aminopeptidase P family protein [Anaerolineaceae bacterium]|nr:aminopeptidase P family protein [Anaerolineaceae bacterium]